jgi:hypothetical protein
MIKKIICECQHAVFTNIVVCENKTVLTFNKSRKAKTGESDFVFVKKKIN